MNFASLLKNRYLFPGLAGATYLGFKASEATLFNDQDSLFRKAPLTLEETQGSSNVMNFMRSIYGGENLSLNLGMGIGGQYISNKISKSAARAEYRTSLKALNKLPAFQNMKQAARSDPAQKMMYDKQISTAKRAARNVGMANKTAKFLGRASKMAMWAPMAFMAFDLTKNLTNIPSPTTPYVARKTATLSGTFIDTGMAYTQRKRALQAMHNSQYSGRSALGNEAALMHR